MSSKKEDPMTNVVIPLTPAELLQFRDWVHSIKNQMIEFEGNSGIKYSNSDDRSYQLLLQTVEETLLAKLEGRNPNKYVVLENDFKLDVSKFDKMVYQNELKSHIEKTEIEIPKDPNLDIPITEISPELLKELGLRS